MVGEPLDSLENIEDWTTARQLTLTLVPKLHQNAPCTVRLWRANIEWSGTGGDFTEALRAAIAAYSAIESPHMKRRGVKP